MSAKPLSSMGQAALAYSRHGWPVFPVRERDEAWSNAAGKTGVFRAKAPYTGSGLKDATTDEQRIIDWWRRHPDAMIGLPTGVNGCFVLDFDPRVEDVTDPETGEVTGTREWTLEQMKADLEAQMGCPLPRSITAVTQSGGVHVYFRQPVDGDPIRNRGNLPEHVDVRGIGGYVVAPPSILIAEDGTEKGRYRWLRDRGDWRDPAAIAEAPPSLIQILRERGGRAKPKAEGAPARAAADRPQSAAALDASDRVRKYALSALDAECRDVRSAGSGARNAQLNRSAYVIAQLVAAGALDEAVARSSIEAAARANPGNDDERQLMATIDSGWSAGIKEPRDLGEVAAARSSRRDGRPAPARPPARSVAATSQPFHPGREEPDDPLTEGQRARLAVASRAWMQRRIEALDPTPDAIKRLAFSIGRRVGSGLIDEHAAKETLWAVYDGIAGITHGDVDQAMDDGMLRGFDPGPLLLLERCSAYPLTDFGIGERFREQHGQDFRFTTAKGWMGWDKRRWKVLDQDEKSPPAEVIAAVFATIRSLQDEARFIEDTGVMRPPIPEGDDHDADPGNPHGLDRWIPKGKKDMILRSDTVRIFGRQSEVAGKPTAIAALARQWLTVPIEDFDRDPLTINVLNGTLRFRREMLPDGGRSAGHVLEAHRREDLNTRLAPIEYDPAATSPVYDNFLAWAHPDEAMRRYLHQCVGYGLSGDTSEQKLWFFYGLGANGKSTAIDLWAHIAGDYSGTIGIETFLDQGIKKRGEQASPDLARLGGVRFLRASEPERGAKMNEALIKAATGGEPMAVRALHRGFFDLHPVFKLFISGNYKPDIPGTDEGIWRRVRLVPWNAHVADDQRDRQLPDKLRAEAQGVFNHMVRGLLDWLTAGLVEPDAVKQATDEYRQDSDPLARFLKLCTEPDEHGRIQSSKLHEVFVAWCKAAGEREWTNKGLSSAMLAKGFSKKASDGMQWLGLRLVKDAADFVDETGRVRSIADAPDDPLANRPSAPPGEFDDVPW